MLKFIPGRNLAYWAMRVKFIAQDTTWAFDGVQTQAWQVSTN